MAGFSSMSRCETMDTKTTKGLLMNVSDRKHYALNEAKSPVLKCSEGISFGTNEIIIIRTDRLILRVCPYQAPAFEFEGDQWKNIFKDKQREISIEEFEIYQIQLR